MQILSIWSYMVLKLLTSIFYFVFYWIILIQVFFGYIFVFKTPRLCVLAKRVFFFKTIKPLWEEINQTQETVGSHQTKPFELEHSFKKFSALHRIKIREKSHFLQTWAAVYENFEHSFLKKESWYKYLSRLLKKQQHILRRYLQNFFSIDLNVNLNRR